MSNAYAPTGDLNGLNAGVLWIKVDVRSRHLLANVLYLSRDRHLLKYQEQSVISSLVVDWKLEETGQFVYMDPPVYNSYMGENAFREHVPVFQIHFPSWPTKRFQMIPLLEKLQRGQYILDEVTLQESKSVLMDIIGQFWAKRKHA